MKLKFKNKIDYRYYIYFAIIAASVLLAIFHYNTSYLRFWHTLVNLGTAFLYYCAVVFRTNSTVTTKAGSLIEIDITPFFPFSVEELLRKLQALPRGIFVGEHFRGYLLFLANSLRFVVLYGMMLALCLYVIVKIIFSAYIKQTEKEGQSKPLAFFLRRIRPKLLSVRAWIYDFIDFGAYHRFFKILGIIWLFNLNVVPIFVAALAFYLYFVASFDIGSIFINVANLFADMVIMFWGLPFVLWLIVGYTLLSKLREHIGYNRLNHNENKNKGFIKTLLSLVNLIVGLMRAGKNLTETDMALSGEQIHRDMALEGMLDEARKFPDFPWRNLEKEVERACLHLEIVDFATARLFVSKKVARFCKNPNPEKLFGYDLGRYAKVFNNGMYYETVFDSVELYAQYYSLYFVNSSLISANYAVRSGATQISYGHFPVWQNDFFHAPPVAEVEQDEMCHILNFDKYRLGKRMDETVDVGIAGYGVHLWSERGKERGNMLDNNEYKKSDKTANPKNDYSNMFLKLAGHNATVGYKNFFLCIGDEQRPESVGADEREISTVLHIENRNKDLITLPFFELETVLNGFLLSHFDPYFVQYRLHRSDGTLFMYLVHHLVSAYWGWYIRKFNTFAFDVLTVGIEKGTLDGQVDMHEYYISHKKTFAKRYSTDAFRNMLATRALEARHGLHQQPRYRGLWCEADEYEQQNSFAVDKLREYTHY